MEEKKELDVLVTKGGYEYILKEDLKVRSSLVGRRLKEDGETFDEYKLRRKGVHQYVEAKAKGKLFWPSKKAPSEQLSMMMAVNPKRGKETPEFKEWAKWNLGTYVKENVDAIVAEAQKEVETKKK